MTRGMKTTIRRHRGPVLVRRETLFSKRGVRSADRALPKLEREKPPPGWVMITKAAAYRLLGAGALVSLRRAGQTVFLFVGELDPATVLERAHLYRERFGPPDRGDWESKPPSCTQDCGGRLPEPNPDAPAIRKTYYLCPLGKYANCPVEKSIRRAQRKRRRREAGLWRRSRRRSRRRLEAQSLPVELPDTDWRELQEHIAEYPPEDLLDRRLYAQLRRELTIDGALDVHLMLTRPLEGKHGKRVANSTSRGTADSHHLR